MNIWKEILKTITKAKIEIIPEDKKDINISKQFSEILNYMINEEKK